MPLETKRIAKAVCKQLQPLLGMTLAKRPRTDKGYTMLQGWRSAMTLSVGSCRRLGMSEEEVRAAMERCLDGFREAEQHGLREHPDERVHFEDPSDEAPEGAVCGAALEALGHPTQFTAGPRSTFHRDLVTCPACRLRMGQQRLD